MNRRLTRGYALLVVFLSIAFIAGTGAIYTRWATERAQRQSDMRWCPLLVIADRPNPLRRPQTPDEVEARRTLHKLRIDLGCGGK